MRLVVSSLLQAVRAIENNNECFVETVCTKQRRRLILDTRREKIDSLNTGIHKMLNLLSLSQLEHKASIEDNMLALAILDKLEGEIEEAVEQATTKNDADYCYEVFDAVQAVEWLVFEAEWYKAEETKQTKDSIIYMIQGLYEDTSPYNNHVVLSKYKGCDDWTLEVNSGEIGEAEDCANFTAKGFKEAQEKAVKQIVLWIKKGTELNV